VNSNPQAEQMADESMVRTLAAQAAAIWPQEQLLLYRYVLPERPRILDVGCGTGEISSRLALHYPEASVVGVDILPQSVALAKRRYQSLGPRLSFQTGDAFALDFETDSFDLVVCRHLTQSVPRPERVLAELVRVCRPGGWIHVLSEDYRMLHFEPRHADIDKLWLEATAGLSRTLDLDERIGRRTWSLLRERGLDSVWVDYVTVDTLRVPRDILAAIFTAWRDGYVSVIEQHGGLPPGEATVLFDRAIEATRDPSQYVVWQVPIVSGRKPPL